MSKIKITSNGVVFHPIKHFWSYMRKYKNKIGWDTYINGQTDGVFFYMNNNKSVNISYNDIDAIEHGKTVYKDWR